MSDEELSLVLLSLVRCGHKPAREWVGLYMGQLLGRMPRMTQQQLARVTAGLAQLDRLCSGVAASLARLQAQEAAGALKPEHAPAAVSAGADGAAM